MWIKFNKTVLMIALLAAGFVGEASAKKYYAYPAVGGYRVYDGTTGKTYYTRNLNKWIADRRRAEMGFGGSINHGTFSKGSKPVAETVEAAARVTNSAVNSAINAAHYVPGWNRAAQGARAIVGPATNSQRR